MIKITDEMVDLVARYMASGWRGNPHMSGDDRNFMSPSQRAKHDGRTREALTAILPLIGEECAKVADVWVHGRRENEQINEYEEGGRDMADIIAAAIREATAP